MSGFVENGEDPFISCNGTHWTNTLFACSGELKIELINDFENKGTMIPIAYLLNCYCQYAVISTEYIQYNMKALYSISGAYIFLNRFVLIDRQLKKAFFHKIVDFIHCLIVSSECGTPPSLPNANYSLENHTMAVYSCFPGFIPNNPNNAIQCKDSNWSSINLTCTCKLQFFFIIIS